MQLRRCESFRFYVAFVNQEGVASLLQDLMDLAARGVKGQILLSQYLNFTDPVALRTLIGFPNLDVKILTTNSMHAKGYFFRDKTTERFLIGSANWTQSALSKNTELNVVLECEVGTDLSVEVRQEFDHQLAKATPVTDQFIQEYSRVYEKAQTRRFGTGGEQYTVRGVEPVSPNKMQSKALQKLAELRATGETKGLLISATGTGKTFLAAFDAKSIEARRVLFVVHRETIARAALETFRLIFGKDRTYGIFGGGERDTQRDLVFTTIRTLARAGNLEAFSKSDFD